jgi:hypothetical protein
MQPKPHTAVGIENDHSVVGEEYTDTPNGIYNYCTAVSKESATDATSQSENRDGKTIYRVPKIDSSGNPCRMFVFRHDVEHNVVIGPPGFNPFGVPPGTCIVEQIATDNWGGTVTNKGVTVTNQTSSDNHPE